MKFKVVTTVTPGLYIVKVKHDNSPMWVKIDSFVTFKEDEIRGKAKVSVDLYKIRLEAERNAGKTVLEFDENET